MSISTAKPGGRMPEVRISGVSLPNKRMCIALTYVYGIGPTTALAICKACNVDPNLRASSIPEASAVAIREHIAANYIIEGDLRRSVKENIKYLAEISCYRGLRHKLGLPVRGQRTKTNARTRKGKPKTVANKKKVVK